ncbi:90ff8f1c-5d48-4058-8eae-330f7acfd536-CDS [Sclerotinia trifoliorum]|uniref:90ff8f1c-5d48-4058-8eae-330f7acfd536-CDS n=1 Tax=Sclerotinia trifoliorum TaxID=28548 RepID=A0A8H2VR50_9HELO|nr:90ff8f1c-5d48-4058-8eae-330f7acfd536-CDS [Sclerotinia trifoliorum]
MAPPTKRRKRNVVESSPHTSENEDNQSVQVNKFKSRLSNLAHSPPPRSSPLEPTTRSMSQSSSSTRSSSLINPSAKTANHHHNAAPLYLPNHHKKSNTKSPSTSPEKPRGKVKTEKRHKNADIHTFFTKQAQRQQAEGETIPKQRIKVLSSKDIQKEADLRDDLISDDDDVGESRAQTVSMVGQAAKRGVGKNVFTNSGAYTPSGSQRFVKPSQISSLESIIEKEDMRPWAERFGPNNLEELGVHKKKVTDVKTWLENVIGGQMRQRLLILKGAAGTGKTTTIQLLAKDMGCDILEWRNPVGSVASSDGFQSIAAQFAEFMGRGGKFGQLDLFSDDNADILVKPEVKPLDRRKQIILVEEFPNTFTRSSSTLQSFRSAILQYLAFNTPPLSMAYNSEAKNDPITPVVMIVSETLLTTTSASADSFTAHRLLGAEILQHPGVGVIEFNAIAPTILAKALEVVIQKESRKSGRRKTPGPQVLKRLGEVGDIRSAIGSLEFMCLRGDVDDWGGKVVFGKGKKISKDTLLTKMEEDSLELITRREASLGIFHAVGKVVYNKRESKAPGDVEYLPHFISHHSRPNQSEVNVNELIDETGTDTPTFIAALHENYILSCEAPPSSFEFSSLDHVNGCIDALSDSELLCPSWDGSLQSSGFGGGVTGTGGDILRQDEMSFQIAVRGILFSLPHPVSRKAPAAAGFRTGKAADAHKMFYPTSLKLWRMKEEMKSTLDLWVTRLIKGHIGLTNTESASTTSGTAAFARPKPGTVESWKTKNAVPASSQSKSISNSKSKPNTSKEENAPPLLSLGVSARTEMLLERLPYMIQISKSKSQSQLQSRATNFSSPTNPFLKSLEKITTFTGIGPQQTTDETATSSDDDESKNNTENWATDKPDGVGTPRRKNKGGGLVIKKGIGGERAMPVQQLEQKFVLSDDDIEED